MSKKDSDCKITREEFQGLADKIDWIPYIKKVTSFQHEITQKYRGAYAASESKAYTMRDY